MRLAPVRVRLCVLAACLAWAPAARGQAPELEVFYRKLDPRDQFRYAWQGKEAVCSAGVFRWEVPAKEFGTNGLDRNFTGYCAEVLVPITADRLYRFRVNSLFAPENYGLAGKDGAALAAQRRATYVKELFGRYFRDPAVRAVGAEEALALQVALWEVIQEGEPAAGQGAAKLDLFGGEFRANYAAGAAPGYVTKAQEYLGGLTGDDGPFYTNPDLRGRELIRLQGVANGEGVVAQSQFALRFAGGGGLGASGGRALTGLGFGGLPVGGFGGPGGGLGVGNGGGGGVVAGTGGGTAATTPTGSASSVPDGSAVVTPSTPPSTGVTVPPVNGGSPPSTTPPVETSPVPAPAGLILGAIALGTLGTWRLGVRVLSAK
jgi:hypothetical protein